jgi:hypothetical protein
VRRDSAAKAEKVLRGDSRCNFGVHFVPDCRSRA